ncbi:hypothetical protein PIB30_007335 [Stylosanthes scabra]|uniref:Uncharacterized protein n=1 Tax=Stylosanthes scabra TaxID=79078 RepID=A0ABU6Y2M7_9FABA|nr:hypothetical protein [Stylosanthes scabra]
MSCKFEDVNVFKVEEFLFGKPTKVFSDGILSSMLIDSVKSVASATSEDEYSTEFVIAFDTTTFGEGNAKGLGGQPLSLCEVRLVDALEEKRDHKLRDWNWKKPSVKLSETASLLSTSEFDVVGVFIGRSY